MLAGAHSIEGNPDASEPQKPSPMNYSATLLITSKTLHVSCPEYRFPWWGMRGNPTSIDTPELLFCLKIFNLPISNLIQTRQLVDRLTNKITVGRYLTSI